MNYAEKLIEQLKENTDLDTRDRIIEFQHEQIQQIRDEHKKSFEELSKSIGEILAKLDNVKHDLVEHEINNRAKEKLAYIIYSFLMLIVALPINDLVVFYIKKLYEL